MNKFKLEEVELTPEISGIKLDTEFFSLVVVPELGGKITSLVNKATGREFLSRTSIPYRRRAYADRFENYERDGADECFPTVEACPYPAFPWEGYAGSGPWRGMDASMGVRSQTGTPADVGERRAASLRV